MKTELIYFITNRDPQPSNASPSGFGKTFNTAPYLLRYGKAAVWAGNGAPALTVFPENLSAQPPLLGSDTFYDELTSLAPEMDVVLYVHGYLTPFTEALQSVAQIQANCNAMRIAMGKKGLPVPRPLQFVLFSWPSDGGLPTTYWNDRRDAEASAGALAAALDRFRRFRATGTTFPARVHLMAQSMGNYALRCGFQVFRDMLGGAVPTLFDQIILTAADEDADAFADAAKLMRLPELGNGVTVYYNPSDPVVGFSTGVNLGRRLGKYGPTDDSRLDHVDVVNVFYVMPSLGSTADDVAPHYYGRLHPRVHIDALQAMAGLRGGMVVGRMAQTAHRYLLDGGWACPVPITMPPEYEVVKDPFGGHDT